MHRKGYATILNKNIKCLINIKYNYYRIFSGAATRIRTGDLILTKDALYRLSYSSIQIPRSFRSAGGDREGT